MHTVGWVPPTLLPAPPPPTVRASTHPTAQSPARRTHGPLSRCAAASAASVGWVPTHHPAPPDALRPVGSTHPTPRTHPPPSKRRVGANPPSRPSRCTTFGGFHPPYSPNAPCIVSPTHSGSTRPALMSRWIDDQGQSSARATNPCLTGLPQQYRTCISQSRSCRR